MPDFAAQLQFLQSPHSYGADPADFVCIETHMSWVFLAGDWAYKLKKPVCLPYLDFRTLQARAFYCREEIRLNARLAPGVYRGLVALQWQDGHFALVPQTKLPATALPKAAVPVPTLPNAGLTATGDTVDWLVLMRRLPVRCRLSNLMACQQVRPEAVDALVAVLGRFYRAAPVASLQPQDYLQHFAEEQHANRAVLLQPRFQLPQAPHALDGLDRLFDKLTPDLGKRVRQGHVVEGHGDLRPDHVYLLPQPLVIDCLEFNVRLRQLDPFHELALLELECAMAGASWIGAHLLAGMARELGEQPPRPIQRFYLAHQALLRARLALAHLLDPQPRTPEKWLPLAQRYISWALAAVAGAELPLNDARPCG